MSFKTALSNTLYKHPRVVLLSIVGITLFFAAQLPRSRFDNNNFRFIPEPDAARIADAKIAAVNCAVEFIPTHNSDTTGVTVDNTIGTTILSFEYIFSALFALFTPSSSVCQLRTIFIVFL